MAHSSFPVPMTPGDFAYWVISAVTAAVVGAVVYHWLKAADPL